MLVGYRLSDKVGTSRLHFEGEIDMSAIVGFSIHRNLNSKKNIYYHWLKIKHFPTLNGLIKNR